jgi:hypothetical protein
MVSVDDEERYFLQLTGFADYWKIFMGLPTTGGAPPPTEKK